jgi:uncharacterized protein
VPHEYLTTLTTPAVEAAQERYGSRSAQARLVAGWDTDARLGEDEAAFIAARDGFHLATVGETGWPYVQYSGGPAGFLHVLDDTTLGWADVRGNRQYLSVGNLGATPKASLFLMDQARRQRLKVLGTAEVLDVRAGDDRTAALVEQVSAPATDGRVERVVLLHVQAHAWNCHQHITPRFTTEEIEVAVEPLRTELARLRAENADLRARLDVPASAST